MRTFTLALAMTLGVCGTAAASPYVMVDASPVVALMIDQGTLRRSGDQVDVDVLVVPKSGLPQIASFRLVCSARTWQQRSRRTVAADLTLSPVTPVAGQPGVVSDGSVGAALLEKACFNRQVNAEGGWSVPTLAEAVQDARTILTRAQAQ